MMTEEQKQKYEMYKRVIAFFDMNKKIVNENPELKAAVEKFRELTAAIDNILISSDETTEDEILLMNSMNTLLEFTKQFDEKD